MRRGFCQFLAVCLLSLLIAGCASPPRLRDVNLLATNVEKTTRLHFVYRQVEMRTVSSTRYGQGAPVVDTGFAGFGKVLVGQASQAFAGHRVTVLSAAVVGGSEILPVNSPAAGVEPAPVLVIVPVSGSTQANRQSTRTSYVFAVQLTDPQSRRLLWKATIDTSTWAGNDFVMKSFEKTEYDDKYALQLLQAVAEQLAVAGLI